MIWFSSDLHLLHANIILYCDRNRWLCNNDLNNNGEWINREIAEQRAIEMTDDLIDNWNSVIGKNDHVYYLGDFAFVKDIDSLNRLTERINGRIHLIRGNHDHRIVRKSNRFEDVSDLKTVEINGKIVVLCHYALAVWDRKHYGSWCLCGHSHGTYKPALPGNIENGLILDVGVDVWNYYPISFDKVYEVLKEKEKLIENRRLTI